MLGTSAFRTGVVTRHAGPAPAASSASPGFERPTVPALEIDGRRLQGTAQISRSLDELVPEPPLFPADPDARARVEEAERWGEPVLQPVPRRLFRYLLLTSERARLWVGAEVMRPAGRGACSSSRSCR